MYKCKVSNNILGGSQSVGPGPAASALPGNVLEMQILRPTPMY